MSSDNFDVQKFEQYKAEKMSIVDKNYTTAENYYLRLKDAFLKSIGENVEAEGQQLKQQNFQQIVQEGMAGDIEYEKFLNEYQELIDQYLSQNNLSDELQQALLNSMELAKTSMQGKSRKEKTDFRLYWQRVSEEFDKIFEQYQMKTGIQNAAKYLLMQVSSFSTTTQLHDTASITGAYSFYKRVLVNRLLSEQSNFFIGGQQGWADKVLSKKAKQGYSYVIGGYIRESLMLQVITDFLSKNQSKVSAISSNVNNPYYDLVIGSGTKANIFSQLEEELDSLNNFRPGIAEINEEKILESAIPYYGIQSKSWQSPKALINSNKNLRDQWFKLGDRANILSNMPGSNSQGQEYDPSWNRGWHNYAAICSAIIYELIGSYQVAYGLQGEFVWTYDLIKQMHENNMILNFYFQRERDKQNKGYFKYPATAELVWQKKMYLYAFYTKSMYSNK